MKTCLIFGGKKYRVNLGGEVLTVMNEWPQWSLPQIPTVGLTYEISADGIYAICTGIGTAVDNDIIIASSYNGLPVTHIANSAFENCDSLTSITIPSSITSIGYYAFDNCNNLDNITVATNNPVFKSIDGNLYVQDESLLMLSKYATGKTDETFTFPDNVTMIGSGAFLGCDNLRSVSIPDSVTEIRANAFSDCTNLSNVVLGNGITLVGNAAFYNCDNLINIEIPGSVITIDAIAFSGCDSLTSIIVAENNNVYSSLDGTLYTKDKTRLIQYATGKSTTEFSIPESVTSIGEYAFADCKLANITISNSVTNIDNYAFRNCNNLKSVTIPSSVTSIGESVFTYGTNIKVYCEAESKPTDWNNNWLEGSNQVVWGYNPTPASAFKYTSDGSAVTITKYIGDYVDVTIPLTINNLPVTTLNNYAFEDCSNLTSVIIPDSVTSIGYGVFDNCSNLTSITIPASVTSIGSYAFRDCNSLTSVYYNGTIDDWAQIYFYSSDSNPLSYGKNLYINNQLVTEVVLTTATCLESYAFYNCVGLTKVTVPKSITSVGEYTFYNCDGLTEIVIPNNIKSIDRGAFSGCSNLTKVIFESGTASISIKDNAFYGCSKLLSIESPNRKASIGASAFYFCSSLQSVDFSGGVIGIGSSAFNSCSNLTNVIIGEYSSGTIGSSAFHSCSKLSEIIIPDGITSISNYAFQECTGLTNAVISDSVTSICQYAFDGCSKLTSITIGGGVTSIEAWAFQGCTKLNTVNYIGTEDAWDEIEIYAYNSCLTNAPRNYITQPDEGASVGLTYALSDDKKSYIITGIGTCADAELVITSKYAGKPVTSIDDGAFSGRSKLTSIVVGNKVKSIGNYAFSSCSGLRDITIPAGVTSIGEYAFDSCSNLTSITIPDSVTSVGTKAFYKCNNLKEAVCPTIALSPLSDVNLEKIVITSGKTIGASVLRYCDSLKSITIPNTVTSIGDYAFQDCSSLTSITIPDSVTSLGIEAFDGCSSLTNAIVGNGVTTIKDNTFLGCNLQSLELGSSLTSIGICAFYKNSNLTSVTIPANVTSIEHSAFQNCGLTSIELPEGLVKLGTRAFFGCPITDLVVPDTVTEFGYDSLDPNAGPLAGCSSLVNLTVPFIGDVKNTTRSYNHLFGYLFRGSSTDEQMLEVKHEYLNYSSTYAKTYYIPASLKSVKITGSTIKSGAFSNCTGLTSIDIGGTTISDSSLLFKGCSSLTSVILPNSMTSIGKSAFNGCSDLTNLVIPKSVKSLGESVFVLCNSLSNIYYCGTAAEWSNITGLSSNTEITDEMVYYYTEQMPTSSGRYWHYVNNVPTVWDNI